jgi:hypothetical protein
LLKELNVKRLFLVAIKVVVGALFVAGAARGQDSKPQASFLAPSVAASAGAVLEKPEAPPQSNVIEDPMIKQASGCCGVPFRGVGGGGYSSGCYGSGAACYPGRRPCDLGCNADSVIGRLFGGVYESICCPDPCYEPAWILGANAALFQDSPRPVTQTRIRWDAGFTYRFPDAAEFFWGKVGTKGPANPSPSTHYNDLTLYQEIAANPMVSTFVEIPYRNIDPIGNPSAAGMGDMNVGVKTVLLDRELLLVAMQFRTYILTGNFTKGLGTGHVSLEPSLLAALKLTPTTYFQSQLAEWIPIGGTPGFQGNTFHYHFSVNQQLYQQGDFLTLMGTLELNGYTFRGQYTDFPGGAVVGLQGANYLNAGPGFRLMFCNRVDLGFGAAFGFGNGPGPEQIYRTELRIRF